MISLDLGQRGIAVATVAVAAVAVAGASAGTPVAVDEMDTQPDSALYGLEKAGESIKEATYAGDQSWELDRAEERVQEYKNMAEKGKGDQFKKLPEQAAKRMSKGAKKASDENGLERARKAMRKHVSILENVQENVPEEAKPAISLAISQSTKSQAVVSKVKSQAKGKELGKQLKKELKKGIENAEKEVKQLRKQVEENLEKEENEEGRRVRAREMVQNVNMNTARELGEMAENIAKNGVSESEVPAVSEILESSNERINAATRAATDNKGLSRAIKASQKHISVLEGVYEKVPEQGKSSIQKAINRSQSHIGHLENLQTTIGAEQKGDTGGYVDNTADDISEKIDNILKKQKQSEEEENQEVPGNIPGQGKS